ncbi:unnamed protein product [Cercospora beticola]|nr:unnamed protein product [Cercospora beticola]
MFSLSLVSVPVMLDTNTETAVLLKQWVRLYHYGHLLMPGLAICTFLLYTFVVVQRRSSGTDAQWRRYALAAATTVTMIPFTLAIMVPTNDTLFRLDRQTRVDGTKEVLVSGDVRALVVRWSWMHIARSCFPLLGAVLGVGALAEDLKLPIMSQPSKQQAK